MASIDEIRLQLEGKKSPFISLLEGAAGGFQTAQSNALNRAKTMLEMEKQRRQMEQQEEIRQDIKRRMDQQTQNELNKTASPTSTQPQQKFKEVIEQDETGYKRRFETVDVTPKQDYTFETYVDPKGVTRRGRANKVTGEIEQRPTDPIAPDPNTAPSYQIVGTQDGKVIAVNPKTLQSTTVQMPGQGPLMPTTQTEGQANAKLYADRMDEADKQLSGAYKRTDFSAMSTTAQGVLPNRFKEEDVQLVDQAKRNFLNATLRRESGASISPTEMDSGNKQYFVMDGDSEAVKKQKAQNRLTAINGIRNAGGMAPVASTGTTTTEAPSGAPSGTVRVKKGNETFDIPASDLADAEKDGFKRVK